MIYTLIIQKGNLFTGAGAKFYYTGLKYDKDKKLRKSKISPPSLDGTDWKHIFIQSHSTTRTLQPNTKFLYCEYKTPSPHLNWCTYDLNSYIATIMYIFQVCL